MIGAGFIGRQVVAAALDAGFATTVVTRHTASAARLAARGADVHAGDAADVALMAAMVPRAAHIVLCATGRLPVESVADPARDAADTLGPVLAVLEAMRSHPNGRLTHLSSGGTVYGRPRRLPVDEDHPCHPIVPYGISRLAAEHYVGWYVNRHGVNARILRIANVYGPDQPADRGQGVIAQLLASARRGDAVTLHGASRVARDFVHVRDVARAIVELPPPPAGGEVLNVGTGVATTLDTVQALVEEVTGIRLSVIHRESRDFDVDAIALDCTRLAARIAWRPMGLREGLVETVAAAAVDSVVAAEVR